MLFRDSNKIGISREKVRKILNIFKRALKKKQGSISKLKKPISKAKMAVAVINKIINENIKPIAIIDYYLKHMTDEHQIKQIDRMLAEMILAIATGNGHKKGNFKIVSFKQLREFGLASLLHRKRMLSHGHLESNFFDFRARNLNKKFKAPEISDILKEEGIIN